MNKKLIVIGIIVLLIAAIVGGYLLYKKATCPPFVFDLLTNRSEFEAFTTSSNAKTSFDAIKTIAYWVKLNPIVTDAERPGIIMGNYPGNATNTTKVLGIEIHFGRKPRIYWNNGQIDWRVNDQVPIDTWAHVAFVIKPSSIEYYRDGELKDTFLASTVASLNGVITDLGKVTDIKYGYDNRTGGAASVNPNGPNLKAAKLLVSGEELTPQEISDLFNKCKPT